MRKILNWLKKDVAFLDSVEIADKLTVGSNLTVSGYSYLNTVNVSGSMDLTGSLISSSASLILFTGLPTSDPAMSGQLWNDSGTLKISSG